MSEQQIDEPTKIHYRACHLCEAICGLEIKTRGEQILSIKGDKSDPLSRGHICPKATALQDLHEDPDRLRQPVKKVDGEWQAIGWDEALSEVSERIAAIQLEHGNDAVAVYGGNPGVHNYGTMTHAGIIRKAVGSKNNFSATSLDQLPHQLMGMAMYGHQFMIPIPDIDHTDFMVIIGGNPLASNGSLMTVPDVTKRLKAIQKRGGRFLVIDPRRSETAEIADEHLFIRPGTDAFLLMAVIQTLFEEDLVNPGHLTSVVDGLDDVQKACASFTPELAQQQTGIDADRIRELARELANTQRAVCYGRMGVSVQSFGTLCQWAIQVINVLIGATDSRGGGLLTSPAMGYVKPGETGAGNFGRWQSRVSGLPEFSGELPTSVMAEEMLTEGEGQIRGLMTIAGNPVLSAPNGRQLDQALDGLEFMVAIDIYINETTRHADIILPPTGPLEHDHYDIAFHRLAVHNTARYNEPVFEPAEDSLHDWQILNQLSVEIAHLKDRELKPLPAPAQMLDMGIQYGHYGSQGDHELALTLDKIREHPHGLDLGPLQPGMAARLCTEDGKIHLAVDFVLADVERLQASRVDLDERELLLIGRRHVRSCNSWMHNYQRLVKGKPRWQLLMHPDDLRARGLEDQSEVRVQSRVGEVVTTVVATDEMMPGVVSLPHGWGHQRDGVQLGIASEQAGVSCNDITDEKFYDRVTGNAALNGVVVTVGAA
ncbi:molybdopterin-dependent oxidoreductase [Pseudomaricurvus alkylphenolicus]|uniref:molybdopterin-dependent oxidoreductase n=1 Tax=Pseudomaricurvus alkylphenolicus TaxID=1306991 RepID=UPI00141F89BA|nr:molybdopterin-dependent oxidoreductase [Pseudomaricurvus alkylphenolicus]NIB43022.1 molybdopterin-dependent oxidoreductase [Pseudomaricurvus alkylphenolicus]